MVLLIRGIVSVANISNYAVQRTYRNIAPTISIALLQENNTA
jgi:hypothetical protein